MFKDLVNKILDVSAHENDFGIRTEYIRKFIDEIPEIDFLNVVKEIGTIPEIIELDSTEEKLYSKASDLVLARCFRLLGLSSKALDGRGDCADIIARSSSGYNYSLVADAKCFRLSRTAKNQKDFKVSNLSDWRGSENEYAILVAPYFQYPKTQSQIYSKALENNVCLLSWEHLSIMLEYKTKETELFKIEDIWDSSRMISRDKSLAFANAKQCFLPKINSFVAKKIGISLEDFEKELNKYKRLLITRGDSEIDYWNSVIERIKGYTKEQAIQELIKAKKIEEKIGVISTYINNLQKD